MVENSKQKSQEKDYKEIIASHSDVELKNVLKKRKLYRKEAAEFAINEAIRRGIIYSEQDLFAKEFQVEQEKFSIFPTVENEKTKAKYIKSIIRTLIVIGVIPLIYGGIQVFNLQSVESVLIFLFGAAWSISAFQFKRTQNSRLVYFLIFLTVLAIAFLIRYFLGLN